MARRIQSSFSAGELDPALHERTNFEKYQSGLKTARNVLVGKTGRLISRPGSTFQTLAKFNTTKCKIFHLDYLNYAIEWGINYVRIWQNDFSYMWGELAHDWGQIQLDKLHFAVDGYRVHLFADGYTMKVLIVDSSLPNAGVFLTAAQIVVQATNSGAFGAPAGGSGYSVQYVFTRISSTDNQESVISGAAVGLMPISVGQINNLSVSSVFGASEIRVYRRPSNGGAYGYLGSAFDGVTSGTWTFSDQGQAADYTHTPPDYVYDYKIDQFITGSTIEMKPRTGLFFQSRLVVSGSKKKEAIHASRIGTSTNFTRDYPYNSASALTFRVATGNSAQILRMLDGGPLVAFTTQGVYSNEAGPLTVANTAMIKRGEWVIQQDLPPLVIPGAIVFVDALTNAVVAINYSYESVGFQGEDLSVYSDHLLRDRKIVSWCFSDGDIPHIVAVLDNGQLLTLTYQKEQLMRAWTHHDTDGLFEWVSSYKDFDGKSQIVYVIKRGDNRCIEQATDRSFLFLRNLIAMDSAVTHKKLVEYFDGAGFPTGVIDLDPVYLGDWETSLILKERNSHPVFGLVTVGMTTIHPAVVVGDVFRGFLSDGQIVDFTVTAINNTHEVVATPSIRFPSYENVGITLYRTTATVSGLAHLNGKKVSILADGYVMASPLNVIDVYPTVIVSGGVATLPEGARAGIVHVGLPYAVDVETLDVTTVEQAPTVLESILCSLVYLKLFLSRALYVSQNFPLDNTNKGMECAETRLQDVVSDMLGNAPQVPYTRREEIITPSDWNSAGRVAMRQVDPLPVEILSIIPDLQVYRKENR